jgi:segregation and condensation protein B
MDSPSFDLQEVKRILEAALLSSAEPLALPELNRLFDERLSNDALRNILAEVARDWDGRSVELVAVASGWRFRARPEYQQYIERLNPQKPPRYSRAVMETLAIIAYRQPVTRGDIEDIRGVVVSTNIIKALEARGWIDVVGHREVPGRPELFATTRQFLDDLNLRSLEELPALEDLGQLVESVAPGAQFDPGPGEETDAAADAGEEATPPIYN